jgi:hypothetical protein
MSSHVPWHMFSCFSGSFGGRLHQISPSEPFLTMVGRSSHPGPNSKLRARMSSRVSWHMFSCFPGLSLCFPQLSHFRYEEPTRGGRIHQISPSERVPTMVGRSGHPGPNTKMRARMVSRVPWHMYYCFPGLSRCFLRLSHVWYEEPTRGGRIHKISPAEHVSNHESIRPLWT